jgi:hypothetical protein
MVYYGRPTRLKPGVEDIIVSTVHALIPDEFRAQREATATDGQGGSGRRRGPER